MRKGKSENFPNSTARKPKQLALLTTAATAVALGIERVPLRFEIEPARFYIAVRQGDQHWSVPVQFTRDEAEALLPRLRQYDWRLGSDGRPLAVAAILAVVEAFIGGAA